MTSQTEECTTAREQMVQRLFFKTFFKESTWHLGLS